MSARRNELVAKLSEIDRQIAKAEKSTVVKGDDDTLQRAYKVLSELRDMRRDLEVKWRRK
jgi:hypothetical protein